MRAERALTRGDIDQRRTAASALGAMPEAMAAPLLTIALADRDTEVRLRAARSAARLRSHAAAEAVVAWLVEPDPRVRLAACELLRQVSTPRAVAALGRVLGDPDAGVRLAAASAMGASASSEAVGPLLGHVDDASAEVRVEIVQALSRLGDRAAALPLQGKMGDSAPEVRRAVARTLGELGEARTASALVLSLRDPVPLVRVAALSALGRLRAVDAVPAIAPLIEERAAPEVRVAALTALGNIGSRPAVHALVPALAGDDPEADSSPARDALIACGPSAVPALRSALASGSHNTAAGAALALAALRPSGAADAITSAIRRATLAPLPGLRALATLGDASAVAAVLELLSDTHPLVRKQAIQTLITLLDPARHDGRAIEPLVASLREARVSAEDREQLVRALGRTGAPRALGFLVPLATAPVTSLRRAALEALGALGPLGQDAVLLAGLSDELASVRLQAALALSAAGAEPSVAPLLERVQHEATYDRSALGIALSGVLSRAGAGSLPAVDRAFGQADAVLRDALIEGLGRVAGEGAGALLARWLRSAEDPADRRKIAEALQGHPEQQAALTELLRDRVASVRAQAAWSGGRVTSVQAVAEVLAREIELVEDADVEVAANAAAALAQLSSRVDAGSARRGQDAMCRALGDVRPYVRANALAGMALGHTRCGLGDRERALLLNDRSDVVRRAAARLLAGERARQREAAAVDDDARALTKCAADDRSGAVAATCARAPTAGAPSATSGAGMSNEAASLVFVVPDGRTLPLAEAAYSLERADGLIRSGLADRRGALLELGAPTGTLRLLAPAPLSM